MVKTTSPFSSWVGMDVGKTSFDVAVHPEWQAGQGLSLASLPKATFPRTQSGAEELSRWLGENGVNESSRAVMEATGRYSAELAEWIPELTPAIVDPLSVKHFGKSLRVRNKTDRIDAAVLARYGAERLPEPWEPLSAEYAELRELVRLRTFTVGQKVASQNRYAELKEPLAKTMARKMLDRLVADIDEIDRRIAEHVKTHRSLAETVELLTTIPGVGIVTATTVLGEIGDLTRFRKSRQLGAFAGLSPRRYESGDSIRGRTRMSKSGSARVRQVLYLAAMATLKGKPNELSCFYERLLKNGKKAMVAIGAVMRKLLILMRALMINGIPFQNGFAKKHDFSFCEA